MSPRTMLFYKKQCPNPSALSRGRIESTYPKDTTISPIKAIRPTAQITTGTKPEVTISDETMESLCLPFNLYENHSFLHPAMRPNLTKPTTAGEFCADVLCQRWFQCIGPSTGGKLQLSTSEFRQMVEAGRHHLANAKHRIFRYSSPEFRSAVENGYAKIDVSRETLDPAQNVLHYLTCNIFHKLDETKRKSAANNVHKRQKRKNENFGHSEIPQFIIPATLEYLPLSGKDRLHYNTILTQIWSDVPKAMFPRPVPENEMLEKLGYKPVCRVKHGESDPGISKMLARNVALDKIFNELFHVSCEVYERMRDFMRNISPYVIRDCDEQWERYLESLDEMDVDESASHSHISEEDEGDILMQMEDSEQASTRHVHFAKEVQILGLDTIEEGAEEEGAEEECLTACEAALVSGAFSLDSFDWADDVIEEAIDGEDKPGQ